MTRPSAFISVPSLSSAFGEGLPLVLAEAMACGIPCVATDSGDAAVIVGDTGRIVPPRNPAALAAAWQQILASTADARRMLGERARARVREHYDLAGVVARYETLYREVAERSAPAEV